MLKRLASKQALYLPKKNKFTIQDFNVKHRAGCLVTYLLHEEEEEEDFA